MKLKQFKKQFIAQLSKTYPLEEARSFFGILSFFYLKYSRLEVVLNGDANLSKTQQDWFDQALQRLLKNEPIQYIIGETEFFSLPFKVNTSTLIPRPETEELVTWILEEIETRTVSDPDKTWSILDIGTGSGCISVALAKNLENARVWGVDISEEALKVAKINAQQNEVAVQFTKMDILNTEILERSYDVIVSNPPYVRELEKKLMHSNVIEFEPKSALFVSDDDPLIFYRKIALLAHSHLKPNGILFFEINEYLGKEMSQMLVEEGFINTLIKRDIYGKDRMIKSFKNGKT